jgi:ethanolamine permease
MQAQLKRSLTPAMVWGLGVGYVISGNFFGRNLGLEKGGTLGLAIECDQQLFQLICFGRWVLFLVVMPLIV